MVDGSLKFDTKFDTDGVNKASDLINKSFSRMSQRIKQTFNGRETEEASSKMKQLQRNVDEATSKVEAQRTEVERLRAEYEILKDSQDEYIEPEAAKPLIEQVEQLDAKIAEARREYERLCNLESHGVVDPSNDSFDWYRKLEALKTERDELLNEISRIEGKQGAEKSSAIEEAKVALDSAEAKLDGYNSKLDIAKTKLKEAFDKKAPSAFSKSVSGATAGMGSFTKRVKGLIKRVFIFSVITKALRSIKNLLSSMATQDEQVKTSLANIKGNLLTAFQPIYEYILPAIQAVLQALEKASAFAAQFSAALFGKSVSQMQKNAKALNEQAKATDKTGKSAEKAGRSLANFDKLNQLSDNSSSSDSSSTSDTSPSFDTPINDFSEKMAKIASYGAMLLGTALLIVGICLVNIPLIIAGIAIVAAGLAVGKNSGAFENTPTWVKQVITWGAMILGAVLLVVGLASGNIKLAIVGIALYKIGSAYGEKSGAFEAMPNWLKQVITWGGLALGTALLIAGVATANLALTLAGIMLMVTGMTVGEKSGAFEAMPGWLKQVVTWGSIALGTGLLIAGICTGNIAVLAAGAVLLGTGISLGFKTGAFNDVWNAIKSLGNKIASGASDLWSKITSGASKMWGSVKNSGRNKLNGIIALVERCINTVVSKANKISWDIPDWVPGLGGKTFGFNLPTVSIPRLATGTVVPRNYGEYAAILGDNKREPEVVSPLSTMKQAFKEVLDERGGSDQPMIIHCYTVLDGKVVGKSAVEYHNGVVRQTGRTPLKGVG